MEVSAVRFGAMGAGVLYDAGSTNAPPTKIATMATAANNSRISYLPDVLLHFVEIAAASQEASFLKKA
jgi:hypothetical protein